MLEKKLKMHIILFQIISLIQLFNAKLFSSKIKMIPERRGERFNSSVVKKVRDKKIFNLVGKQIFT